MRFMPAVGRRPRRVMRESETRRGSGTSPTKPTSAVNAGRAGVETSKSSGARERDDKSGTEHAKHRAINENAPPIHAFPARLVFLIPRNN